MILSIVEQALRSRIGALGAVTAVAILLAASAVQTARLSGAVRAAGAADKARDLAVLDLGRCREGRAALEAQLARQSAAVEDLSRAGAARLAAADAAVRQVRKAGADAAAKAARILAEPPPGQDACARAEAARRAVAEAL